MKEETEKKVQTGERDATAPNRPPQQLPTPQTPETPQITQVALAAKRVFSPSTTNFFIPTLTVDFLNHINGRYEQRIPTPSKKKRGVAKRKALARAKLREDWNEGLKLAKEFFVEEVKCKNCDHHHYSKAAYEKWEKLKIRMADGNMMIGEPKLRTFRN
ncbi:hypothetical protein G7Y89_g570 [Cudoniella acicularis]|uniref:Uncharacterized protein n=1 Tax=Cudoniella acicularis TaxID=354080 RepID=A0A8H4WAB0_9HELO|nr:hypothetical protein G7Y89_g570 [Cudoniella acicularis]